MSAVERYRKKDMLQTADTLLKANDAIERTARSNPQGAAEALVQCQESAIALGTRLETFGETYANLVHILEDYCENIYQMSESLSDENLCRKLAKKIQKQLTALQNGIKYDLPEDKKEIVFLPYKASMWDSLESLWKAADADPDCDAYVIPIPYFDKNPDGSFREEHYEGDLYPEYVPVTRYDEYDLEMSRPDVIYIHNPYDECNHVTSVHPYFYSKNLRNYTDKLVYIPYFILKEIEPDDQAEIDRMKHFCFTPGTIWADQVVVQSEKMRQIYINEYIKASKEMGLSGEHVDRKFLEKKFLGTGSPKIDKVLNTKKEDLMIPAEWLKVIEKPDGSWKKIIFYNTSVSALLHHDEKMLRKMEWVFAIFKENREEVALLWRPHPLIQATIGSMRPQLWEAYREIRDRYIEEGWGIYDDTADMDRAVVLSDAYYGDGSSSVVQLYKETGKPLMVQNVEVFEICQYIPEIVFSQEYGGKLWFSAGNYKGIFSLDIYNGEVKLEKGMNPDEEPLEQKYLWGFMLVYNHYIVGQAINAKSILLLDMDKRKSVSIDDKEILNDLKGLVKYSTQIKKANKIYLIPACAKRVLEVDLQEKKASVYLNMSDKYTQFFKVNYGYLSTGAFYEYDGKVYMPLYEKSYLMVIDLYGKNVKFTKVLEEEHGLQTLVGNGEFIYIITHDGRVIQWNIEKEKIEKQQNLMVNENIITCLVKGFVYEDSLYFMSGNQSVCLRIKVNDLEVFNNTLEKIWNIQPIENEVLHFTYFDQKERVFLVSEERVVIVNLRSKVIESRKIVYPTKDIRKYLEEESVKETNKQSIYYENDYLRNLRGFLRLGEVNG